ncbi:MAG: FAD-dependent pyridine nucleotide-disulfide oxidoreductase [Lasallia pustulata]|uniref:FAD-dependent pyridine nucleotide-disulfide oxidoreductase n=1 Tax=Lasallia pustulata TaxID=136370 RepID=A0A5M8PMY5_9LECA|nr:MAG: FAD-dependent pyridine nucleotide-disulfide oxidoreductase [Lasallia pustulata]
MALSSHYDALIIGSGQGGTPLASAFAKAGRKAVLLNQIFPHTDLPHLPKNMAYKLPRGATPIPQLTDTNYRTWAIYVKNYLRAQGYWDVVDGGPTTQALAPQAKKWDMGDARAWLDGPCRMPQ